MSGSAIKEHFEYVRYKLFVKWNLRKTHHAFWSLKYFRKLFFLCFFFCGLNFAEMRIYFCKVQDFSPQSRNVENETKLLFQVYFRNFLQISFRIWGKILSHKHLIIHSYVFLFLGVPRPTFMVWIKKVALCGMWFEMGKYVKMSLLVCTYTVTQTEGFLIV